MLQCCIVSHCELISRLDLFGCKLLFSVILTLTLCLDVAEGRMQAYGWSLPAKYSTEVAEGGKSLVSVPVPVYCRPLNLNDPGMKVSAF